MIHLVKLDPRCFSDAFIAGLVEFEPPPSSAWNAANRTEQLCEQLEAEVGPESSKDRRARDLRIRELRRVAAAYRRLAGQLELRAADSSRRIDWVSRMDTLLSPLRKALELRKQGEITDDQLDVIRGITMAGLEGDRLPAVMPASTRGSVAEAEALLERIQRETN